MILSVIIFCSFLILGFLIVRRVSLNRLGKKGLILLPILILGAASLSVNGAGIIRHQLEPKYHGESSSYMLSWRDDDPIVRAASSLPAGFKIEVVMPDLNLVRPTAMTLGDDGDLYLATAEGIFLLRENLETIETFDSYDHKEYILGLAFKEGSLYFSREGSIFRITDNNGDGRSDGSKELISDLPHQVYSNHSNNGISFGPDGLLYLTLGSTSDHGPEESDIAGSILTINPDGTDLTVYARGFRNPFDLDFCSDGKLFATDNGPDQLNFNEDPSTDRLVYRPPDELNLVDRGKNYGYPKFFGHAPSWSNTISPVSLFSMSAVATGVTCYEGEMFPEEYRNNLFVTLWGSMVIPEQTGHKLVRVEIDNRNVGTVSNFADFWRPIDVITYTDGSLLVLDFDAAKLYRISYEK